MVRRYLTALALALALPAWAAAQPAYTLKIPEPATNDVNRVDCNVSQAFGLSKYDAFGKQYHDESTYTGSRLIYNDTILETVAGKITRFRRQFEVAQQSVRDDPAMVMACQGKTIIVENRDDKIALTWENGQPPPDGFVRQVEALLKGNKEQMGAFARVDPLPNGAVKAGDSWDIDIGALVRECQEKHGCEIKGAAAKAKLVAVEKRDIGTFAVVKVHVFVPLERIQRGERVLKLTSDSGMTWDATYDFCCDGTCSAFKSENHFRFMTTGNTPESSGLSTRVRLDTQIDLIESRSPAK
jgi:hypothetical protein